MTCFIFHDWEKWERVVYEVVLYPDFGANAGKELRGTEEWQIRTCKKCGKKEKRKV